MLACHISLTNHRPLCYHHPVPPLFCRRVGAAPDINRPEARTADSGSHKKREKNKEQRDNQTAADARLTRNPYLPSFSTAMNAS